MFDDEIDEAPASVAPAALALAQPGAPRLTPAQWAEKLGRIKRADPRIPQSETHADWQHAAADQLYGWSQHAYHYQGQPFLVTQADYENAIGAAVRFPLCGPHEPALPPSQVARFKDFRPRTARGG